MATLSPLLPPNNHHQHQIQQQSSSNIYQQQQQQQDSNNQLAGMINNNKNNNQPKPRGRRRKIRTEPIRPICPQCDKQFSNQSALTKHKLTHSDERKFACQQCSKAFKRHDHLTGHMQTHSNRKPFNCNFHGCDKTYCDARSLRRHKENIHGQLTTTQHHHQAHHNSLASTSTASLSSTTTATITSSSSNSSSTTTLASSTSSLSTQLEFKQNRVINNNNQSNHLATAISNPNLNSKTTTTSSSGLNVNTRKELSPYTQINPNSSHDHQHHQNYNNNTNNNNNNPNHYYHASYSADYVMNTQRFTFDDHDLMMAQSTPNQQQQPGQYHNQFNQSHQQQHNNSCDIKPINNNNFFSPSQGPASAGVSSLTNLDPQLQNAVSAISLNVNHDQQQQRQQQPSTPLSASSMITQQQPNSATPLINNSSSEQYFKNEINNINSNNNNYAYDQQQPTEKTTSTFSLQSNIQSQLIQRRSHKQNIEARFPGPIVTTNRVQHQHPHTVGYEYSRPSSMYTPLEPSLHDHHQNNQHYHHHHQHHAPYSVDYINQPQFNFDQNSIMSQSRLHTHGHYSAGHYPQDQHHHSSNEKLLDNTFLSPHDRNNTATSSVQNTDSTLSLSINYEQQHLTPAPLSNDPMLTQPQETTTLINNSSDCYFKNDINNNSDINNNNNNNNNYIYENDDKITSPQSNDQSQLLQRRSHKQNSIVSLPAPIETTDLDYQEQQQQQLLQQQQQLQSNLDTRSSIMYTPLEPNLHDHNQHSVQNQFYNEDQHSGTPYSDYKPHFTFDQI